MSDFEDKIKNWLNEQGYPLEMRVAGAFRRAGFRVVQSEHYDDPVTGTHREIDVVASLSRRLEGLLLRVEFLIECKSSRSKPWLMFCAADQRLANPARVAQRTASEIGSEALLKLAQRKDIQQLDLFAVTHPPAYAITQAFTSGSDVAYTALTTVAAGAAAAAIQMDAYTRIGYPVCLIAFPIVVIEGKLFTCVLEQDASIAVTEVHSGTLLSRNKLAGEPHTIVALLTDTHVSEFAQQAAIAARAFLPMCETEMIDALHNWEARNTSKPDPRTRRRTTRLSSSKATG